MAIFDASHVFLDNPASKRDEALAFIAEKGVELGVGSDARQILIDLKARETEGATGMMSGFAIPHCKSAAVSDPCVIVARFQSGITWQTMDNKPVTCCIALLIPDDERGTEHLRLLSKIAVMLMHEDFCTRVQGATSVEDIAQAVSEGLQ